MTLVLELPTDLQSQVEAEARQRGTNAQSVVIDGLRARYGAHCETDETKRRALVRSLRGRAQGRGPTVDEFLAERQAEARAEAGL